ncbi:B-cell receptor CD22-like isoform 2-T5 [Salvelinus alpinus]
MALRTAGSVLVVFLWSVAVVLGQDGWSVTYTTQSICALKGSAVDLSCSYTYPSGTVTTTLWFTKIDAEGNPVSLSDDPDYKGRVTYHKDNKNNCTLTITDLRESDAATYWFRFITDQTGGKYYGDPGITLSVTDVQVKVTPYSEISKWKTLTCSTNNCPLTGNPTYTWYKNGQIVTENTSPYSVLPNAVDSYFCAVKGHEDLSSPAVYKPKNTSVSVSPSGEIVEGSSVNLTCSSDANPPVQSYIWWYKKNGSDYQSMTGPQHVFNQIQSSDTGEYYCEAQNEMGTERSRTINMDVKYGPKNNSVSVSPSGEIVEGSSVTLICSSDANPPVQSYTWYKKNGASLTGSEKTYNFTTISSEDSGEYYCEAENKYGRLNSSSVSVDVQYGPKDTSVSVSPSRGIVEGSSVILTCSSDANPPVDKYTWYFQNETFLNGFGEIYNISNFQSKNNGHYHCEAWNGRGSRNSTALMIFLPEKQTSGIIVVVLVVILCLVCCMSLRKCTGGCDSTADTQRTTTEHGLKRTTT